MTSTRIRLALVLGGLATLGSGCAGVGARGGRAQPLVDRGGAGVALPAAATASAPATGGVETLGAEDAGIQAGFIVALPACVAAAPVTLPLAALIEDSPGSARGEGALVLALPAVPTMATGALLGWIVDESGRAIRHLCDGSDRREARRPPPRRVVRGDPRLWKDRWARDLERERRLPRTMR